MSESMQPRRSFGSLYRQKNGRWLARFPDPTGETNALGRIRVISRTLPSRRAGEKFLREMEKAIAAARETAGEDEPIETPLTLLQAIDEYLKVRGKRLSPLTVAGYRSSRNAVALHPVAEIPITRLRPTDIDDYLDWRKGTSLVAVRIGNGKARTAVQKNRRTKGGTLNRDLTTIQAALSEQVRRERLSRNPASLVKRRKMQESPRQAFQETELQRFIAACEPGFLPLVLGGVYTGARIGELTRLVWGDIYFETAQIMLRRTKSGNASAIPMHPELARHLRDLRKRRSATGSVVRADEPVFLTPKGKIYRDVRGPWRRAMQGAGLADRKGLTFHSLRHTFSTRFLEGGAAVTDLQRILGHRNLTTTQIYAHMVDARARASVEALDFGLARVQSRDEMCYSMCSSRLDGESQAGRQNSVRARGAAG